MLLYLVIEKNLMPKLFEPFINDNKKWNKYTIRNNNIKIKKQVQLNLFENGSGNRTNLGLFFEILTSSVFGGNLIDSNCLIDDEDYINPDVLCNKRKIILESKASYTGYQGLLLDAQVARYRAYQIAKPDYDIYWIFWRHNFKNVMKFTKSTDELFKELPKAVRGAICLPFSIICQMHNGDYPEIKRYEWQHRSGENFLTRISSLYLNKFILDFNEACNHYRLNYKNFTRKICKVDTLKINNKKVNPFVLCIVKDKYYEDWKQKISEEVPF